MTLLLDHPMVLTAHKIAKQAHHNQADGEGLVLARVVLVASGLVNPRDQVVALLSSVLTQTTVTGADLYDEGIPLELILDVVALTRKTGEPRYDFMARIQANGERPVRVKTAILAGRSGPTPAWDATRPTSRAA